MNVKIKNNTFAQTSKQKVIRPETNILKWVFVENLRNINLRKQSELVIIVFRSLLLLFVSFVYLWRCRAHEY